MERIQPPPNYYGAPYPQPQEGMPNPYQSQPMNNYPPQQSMPPYPNAEQPINSQMRQNISDNSVNEFYESFNKLISTNLGRSVNVHCSFTDSTKWHDKEFRHYLIVGVYVDYIEFFDKITMDGVTSK